MDPPALLAIYPLDCVKVTITLLNDPYHPISTWATIDLSSSKSLINQNIFSNDKKADIAIDLKDERCFIMRVWKAALPERTVSFIRDRNEEFGTKPGMHIVPGLRLGSKDMLRLTDPLTVHYKRREDGIREWDIPGLGLIFCSKLARMKFLEKNVIETCEKKLNNFLKGEEFGLVEFSLYSQWGFTEEESFILVIPEIAHRPDAKKIDIVRAIVATADPFGYTLPFRLDYKDFLAEVLTRHPKWNQLIPWKEDLIGSSLRIDDVERSFKRDALNTVQFFFCEDENKSIVVAYNKAERGEMTNVSFLLAKYLPREDRLTFDYLPQFLKKKLPVYILSFTIWKSADQLIEGRLQSFYESALATNIPVTIRLVSSENNPAFFGAQSLYQNYRIQPQISIKQLSLWFEGPELLKDDAADNVTVSPGPSGSFCGETTLFITSL